MRRLRYLLAVLALAAVYGGLAWRGVAPGGATLRGLLGGDASDLTARGREDARRRRLVSFAAENATAPEGAVVFLGSSTIEFWPLAESFPDRICLNRGIGSESAREILGRLEGSLPARPPGGIVIYTGSADLRAHGLTPEEAARDAGQLLGEVRRRHSTVAMIVLGVLPGRDLTAVELGNQNVLNAALAEAAAHHGATFVPTDQPPLATPSGSLDPSLSRDRWHLNDAGYRALTGLIRCQVRN